MKTFIIRRLLQSIVVLFLVTIIVFLAIRYLPGDPLRAVLAGDEGQTYSEAELQELRHQYGLDKPVPIQYLNWVKGVFHGDLGNSFYDNTPVLDEMLRRLPITMYYGFLAISVGLIIGIPIGIISAVRRGKWIDQIVITLTNLGITVPNFWVGLLLMLLFGLRLGWLPVMGYTSPFEDLGMHLKQLVMPTMVLSLFTLASTARQTRSSMLEVMRQDYIRTAWSQGWREIDIIFKHALKNGLIPVITLAGMQIPLTVGGAVITEAVFNVPGMGLLAVTAVQTQDYPFVQGIILFIATMVVLTNLLIEIWYGWADPRIRYN